MQATGDKTCMDPENTNGRLPTKLILWTENIVQDKLLLQYKFISTTLGQFLTFAVAV